MNLSSNKVLITGGGSGIGLEMAKLFLSKGSDVIITGRNEAKLQKACESNPGLAYHVSDVTQQGDIDSLLARIKSEGGINILVNNAGVFNEVSYLDDSASVEGQLKEIDINLNGPIRMVNSFLPVLEGSKNPAIINVSSGLAFVPISVAPVYCATKAALHSWTQSLRFQMEKKSVKVFELMPPLVATEMTEQYKKFNPISTEKLMAGFEKDFSKDRLEITVGQSNGLKKMSRYAPKFIFKQLNKTFS